MSSQFKIGILIIFLSCSSLYGQEVNESSPILMPQSIGSPYDVYLGADKGLQINVQIWGEVLRPGMYSVPKTTDVIGLVSFAGGPTESANISKIKLVRNNPQPEVFDINLKSYTKTGKTELIPILKPGDTVIVPENMWHKFSKAMQTFSQIAIIANVYYLLFGVRQK
ncbi:MAG: SLBB domain-containing protein [Candidatus Stahlbacteria bacterium]|nr:SLBB domain-containing protein [Candidatus Stahlbacteria bacterium]